jgi:Domain of unknown function (DUF397)
MDIDNVTWRKASYSGDNGGGCIEVGVWRKATHSGGNGGGCVEVATADTQIAVRDSKDPVGPQLSFTPSAWRSFMARHLEASRP